MICPYCDNRQNHVYLTTESIFSESAPQIKALDCNPSAFSTLFAPGKSWDNMRSTTAPYTESRLTRKAVSETTNRQIESVNRERESVATLLFFWIHYRISLSTITFEFRTISVSVSPLIFLQLYRSSPIEIER